MCKWKMLNLTRMHDVNYLSCRSRTNYGKFCPKTQNVVNIWGKGHVVVAMLILKDMGVPALFCWQAPTCYRTMGSPWPGTWRHGKGPTTHTPKISLSSPSTAPAPQCLIIPSTSPPVHLPLPPAGSLSALQQPQLQCCCCLCCCCSARGNLIVMCSRCLPP